MALHRTPALVVVSALLACAGVAAGQLGSPFSGRLEPIAADQGATPPTGTGFIYSVMDYYPEGPKLMVNGTFDGLTSSATVAHLHRATTGPNEPDGPTPGPKAFDLVVSTNTSGTFNGSFWITEEQAEELRQGWYYVQIHSEDNPAGALRGWLVQGFLQVSEDSPTGRSGSPP